MAKIKNTGDGNTKGWGELDPSATPPGPTYTDPGARNLNDPDWVRRDRLFKEQLPQPKYY